MMLRNAGKRDGAPAKRTRTKAWVLALVGAVLVANASPGLANEYESDEAGHPLRIIAYVLHPVGVVLDYLILRPAHWIGSHEPFKTAFGHED